MPDPFEVHSSSRWEWGSDGRGGQNAAAIADQLADPAPAKPAPDRSRKDLWGRCKHAPDKKHHPVFIARRQPWFGNLCQWGIAWYRKGEPIIWQCRHQEECEYCHKVFETFVTAERCPDYPGCEEQKAAVYEEYEERKHKKSLRDAAWQQRLAAQQAAKSRRTSYRRPKAGKKGA